MTAEILLSGRTVLVTRPVDQSGRLAEALRAAGAHPLEIPTIVIEPPATWDPVDVAVTRGGYDWVVFTSANGVTSFLERLAAAGADQHWWRVSRVAAVGPRTAELLREAGIRVDVVPDEFVADALVA